jgi:hypothetical protein
MEYLKSMYPANNKLRYMQCGRPKASTRYKSALEKAMTKKRGRMKRKRAEDDDGLGADDVEFGFGAVGEISDGEGLVDGEEGEV